MWKEGLMIKNRIAFAVICVLMVGVVWIAAVPEEKEDVSSS